MSIPPELLSAVDWRLKTRDYGQIIAIARTNDLVLVTLNVADYAAFEGVKVEDWSKRV